MCENTPNSINENIEQTTEWDGNTGEQITETQETIETNDVPTSNPEPAIPTEDIEIDETVAIEPTPENE